MGIIDTPKGKRYIIKGLAWIYKRGYAQRSNKNSIFF